jgi:hypothetical protein
MARSHSRLLARRCQFVTAHFASRVPRVALPRSRAARCAGTGFVVAVAFLLFGSCTTPAHAAKLPTTHPYQQTLRDYLAGFTAADFDVKLAPLTFRDTWFPRDDDLYRLWLLTLRMPHTNGITLPSCCFLLPTIESDNGIRMRAGGRGGLRIPGLAVDPQDLCWWATWDFRGNPYFRSRPIRNRAFTIAAVDMVMLDDLHESGKDWVANARRSDFLSGTLVWLTYVYLHVRQDLPEGVRLAYETGLKKLFARLNEWGPTRVNDNMDSGALVAAAYLQAAIDEGPATKEAREYCRRVLDIFHPAGMVRDAGGLEASYNGIALFNLAWATSVTSWPDLNQMQRQTAVLKGLLTLPEPDGKCFFGPSHFNTRTGAGSPTDQWSFPQRDIAIAMREPSALYLAFGGRNQRASAWAVPEPTQMSRDILTALSKFNDGRWQRSDDEFPEWVATWWGSGAFNYAYEHYVPGFYDRLRAMKKRGDTRMLPPLLQPAPSGVAVLPPPALEPSAADRDTFAIARYPSYAAVVYTGPLGRHGYMNFCGGALAAFWTPTAGAAVLGRSGKPVPSDGNPQTWANWRMWPTHALSGETPTGDAFSSARIRRRVSKIMYEPHQDGLEVRIEAPLGKDHDKGHAVQNDCLTGDVRYSRRIAMGQRGVAIHSRIRGDQTDKVVALNEIIPLTLFDARLQNSSGPGDQPVFPHHRVLFETAAGHMTDATPDFMDEVRSVVVERFAGRIRIRFATPQRIRIGEVWEDDYQTRMQARNLLVDLLGTAPRPVALGDAAVSYLISAE